MLTQKEMSAITIFGVLSNQTYQDTDLADWVKRKRRRKENRFPNSDFHVTFLTFGFYLFF